MINVLVFPCGSEIGLEVHNALRLHKDINVIGLSSVASHGRMVYKNYLEDVPHIKDPDFIPRLNEVIEKYQVDCIVPAYDDVILFLAENSNKINCKIITSEYETCRICRSKEETYRFFSQYDFVPVIYSYEEISSDKLPVFAKPDIGQGSQGVAVICSEEQLASWKERAADYVFSELLTGEEYTVDCFTDQNGNLLVMSMRQRIRVKSGISVNTRLVPLPEAVGKIGRIINENLKLRGAWFFQVKKNSSEQFKLLEVAPRVAGSMCTSRLSGFNYILNSIYTAMEVAIRSIPRLLDAIEVDRAFVSRYDLGISYDTVYLDFDDTVTLHQKVNSQMMALIYQWKNQGKTIKILTRHAQDIYQTMETLCIDHRLFDQIIEVEEKQLKSQYIVDEKAIFIDDSFRERFDVSEKTGIPVFDVDGIEGLLDWRY